MPPHLHPRSRMTTSLFTTTLMVSFLVVATPHLLPCPVDPRAHADSPDPSALSGEPRPRRRRRRCSDDTQNDTEREEMRNAKPGGEWATPKRECPVPKPGGLIGQVLGLRKQVEEVEDTQQPSVTRQVGAARNGARNDRGPP